MAATKAGQEVHEAATKAGQEVHVSGFKHFQKCIEQLQVIDTTFMKNSLGWKQKLVDDQFW